MLLWRIINIVRLQGVDRTINKSLCGCYQKRFLSAKAPQNIIKQLDPTTGEVKKKKLNEIPKITLLQGDLLSVTTLPEAEKLAKRRDLKLVKIVDLDTKSQRPIYKLMSGVEFHEEDLKQREQHKKDKSNYTKGEKVLMLNSRINDHDLEIHLKKTIKWIEKMFEVRVAITFGENRDLGEKVFKKIEQYFKEQAPDAKIVQKRVKGFDIKFQIMPSPKQNNNDDKESNKSML